jgi:uncharacterized protein YdaU (DUF1376 family)
LVSYNFEQRLPLAGEKRILHPSADVLLFVKQANEVRSKMHYYQFNIGDYQSHTGHLSEIEDLAYRRMLDWIYLHEKPIPKEINEVARNIRMRTHCESIAIVLQEFFTCTETGWVSDRVQREIAKAGDKSRKASESARARWDADALRTQSEGNATHNTLPITQDTIKTDICPPDGGPEVKIPDCDHKGVKDLYHLHLPTLRKVEVWNAARQGYLRQRWREVATELAQTKPIDSNDVLSWWAEFFKHIGQSKFLVGKVNSKDGRAFTADLEWILKPSNFAKIVEGKYHGAH